MRKYKPYYLALALVIAVIVIMFLRSRPTEMERSAPPTPPAMAENAALYEQAVSIDDLGRGREIVEKAVEALGGLNVYEKVNDLTKVSKRKVWGTDGEKIVVETLYYKRPDKIRIDGEADFITKKFLPKIKWYHIFDGEQGWIKELGLPREASENEIQQLKAQIRGLPGILRLVLLGDYSAKYVKDQVVEGKQCHALDILDHQRRRVVRVFIDTSSFLMLKREERITLGGALAGTPAEREVLYYDYGETPVGMVPFHIVDKVSSPKYTETDDTQVVKIEVNTGVKDDVFKKP